MDFVDNLIKIGLIVGTALIIIAIILYIAGGEK
jgi:hypothetical protein